MALITIFVLFNFIPAYLYINAGIEDKDAASYKKGIYQKNLVKYEHLPDNDVWQRHFEPNKKHKNKTRLRLYYDVNIFNIDIDGHTIGDVCEGQENGAYILQVDIHRKRVIKQAIDKDTVIKQVLNPARWNIILVSGSGEMDESIIKLVSAYFGHSLINKNAGQHGRAIYFMLVVNDNLYFEKYLNIKNYHMKRRKTLVLFDDTVTHVPINQASLTMMYCSNNRKFESRRKKFCLKYDDGYFDYCVCNTRKSISFAHTPLYDFRDEDFEYSNKLTNTPITIVASSRPKYLLSSLTTLLNTPGVDKNLVTVYIDGIFDEVQSVVDLFDVRYLAFEKLCQGTCSIAQHYRRTLITTFNNYREASEMIIIEEDLRVSSDFMYLMDQTVDILRRNDIYCVSAWNDYSYKHTMGSPTQLMYVDAMPGLGWMLKRKVFFDDMLPVWPTDLVHIDWDVMVRQNPVRKGRKCIIPDVSRTFHFGEIGTSINPEMHKTWFQSRPMFDHLKTEFDTKHVATVEAYDEFITALLKYVFVVIFRSKHVAHPQDLNIAGLCSVGSAAYKKLKNKKTRKFERQDFSQTFKQLEKNTVVIYLKFKSGLHHPNGFIRLAKCWRTWYLDVRDFYDGLFRIWLNNVHYVLVDTERSKFAALKPPSVHPFSF